MLAPLLRIRNSYFIAYVSDYIFKSKCSSILFFFNETNHPVLLLQKKALLFWQIIKFDLTGLYSSWTDYGQTHSSRNRLSCTLAPGWHGVSCGWPLLGLPNLRVSFWGGKVFTTCEQVRSKFHNLKGIMTSRLRKGQNTPWLAAAVGRNTNGVG